MTLSRSRSGARALHVLPLASALVLAACGGGGDGASSAGSGGYVSSVPAVAITAANQETVASNAFTALSTTDSNIAANGAFALWLATQQNNNAERRASAARAILPQAAAATPTTFQVPCQSGTATIVTDQPSFPFNNANTQVTASNCVIPQPYNDGTLTVNGSVSMTYVNNATDSAPASQVTRVLTATQFAVSDTDHSAAVNGSLREVATRHTNHWEYVYSTEAFTSSVSVPGEPRVTITTTLRDYNVTTTENDADEATSTIISGTVETIDSRLGAPASYQVSTPVPLVGYAPNYDSGKVLITGNGSTLQGTFQGDGLVVLQRNGVDAGTQAEIDLLIVRWGPSIY